MEKLFGRAANKKIFCDVNYTFFQLGGLFLCQYFLLIITLGHLLDLELYC